MRQIHAGQRQANRLGAGCEQQSVVGVSAAAKPAAPPPTMTTLPGNGYPDAAPLRPCGIGASFCATTKTLPSRGSTDQQATELNAGACNASPVRKLKQA